MPEDKLVPDLPGPNSAGVIWPAPAIAAVRAMEAAGSGWAAVVADGAVIAVHAQEELFLSVVIPTHSHDDMPPDLPNLEELTAGTDLEEGS